MKRRYSCPQFYLEELNKDDVICSSTPSSSTMPSTQSPTDDEGWERIILKP